MGFSREIPYQQGVSPRAVAERSDVVFTIVGFPADVRDVYLGDNGIVAGATPGSIVVDMTTTEPSLAREIPPVLNSFFWASNKSRKFSIAIRLFFTLNSTFLTSFFHLGSLISSSSRAARACFN